MAIGQKDMINSLSHLLDWLEREKNWGTNRGELKFITGRIGELYAAIMTNGQMAASTNQKGYDVVSEENERISVKATTSWVGTHQFKFNTSTLNQVDRVILIFVDVEEVEIKIIYDASIHDARKLMVDADNGSKQAISMSKVISKKKAKKDDTITDIAEYDAFRIERSENGTILLKENSETITPTRPALRKIAQALGVDINNGNGNEKNTRTLGWDIIKQINPQEK